MGKTYVGFSIVDSTLTIMFAKKKRRSEVADLLINDHNDVFVLSEAELSKIWNSYHKFKQSGKKKSYRIRITNWAREIVKDNSSISFSQFDIFSSKDDCNIS